MMDIAAGLVLPQSVLESTWFSLLATIVAFNTLVYIGLTLSKLVPLPKPARAATVRSWLRRFGITVDEEAAVKDLPETTWTDTSNPRELLRTTVAGRYLPTGLIALGGLTTVLSLISISLVGQQSEAATFFHLGGVVLGLAILITSQVVVRSRIGVGALQWVWLVANLAVAGTLIVDGAVAGNQTSLAYVLILLVAFPSIAMAWTPTLIGNGVVFAGVVVAAFTIPGDEDIRIVSVALIAALVGGGLLRLRLLAIDALADETVAANTLATTDPATGVLTRNGIQTLMPALAGIADRAEANVMVIYVDIDKLGEANIKYGIDYGNSVLKVVADAIRVCVRTGDLISRYSGDSFLVAGLGDKPSARDLADRIEQSVAESGTSLGRTPIRVNVGTASGNPRGSTFEGLVQVARRESGDSTAISS